MQITKGCILKITPYKDSSSIIGVFTQEFGWISYCIKGLRGQGKKAKSYRALLRPMMLVEIQTQHYLQSERLPYLSQLDWVYLPKSLYQDPIKINLLFCINETLNMCLENTPKQKELYEFIALSLQYLDTASYMGNFLNVFLIKLSRFLGFGLFKKSIKTLPIATRLQLILINYTQLHYHTLQEYKTNASDKRQITSILFYWYGKNIPNFQEPKSWKTLLELASR